MTSTPGVLTRVGRDDADRHDVLRLGDDDVARERDDRIEIVRGQRIFEVAVIVGLLAADQGEIAADRRLQQVGLAVDLDDLLALLDQRADAGRGEDAAEPHAAGADSLDQRSLGHELNLDLAGNHLGLSLGIEADVGGDHVGDRAGRDQLADPPAGHRGVIGDDGEVLRPTLDQRVDQPMGRADAHEAADQEPRSVGNQGGRFVGGDRGFHRLRPLMLRPGLPGGGDRLS